MLDTQLFLPPRSAQLREYCNHVYHAKLPTIEGRKGRKERTNQTPIYIHREIKKTLLTSKIVHIQISAHKSLNVTDLSYVMIMMDGLIGCALLTARYTRSFAV